jgi:lipoyl-dependent peroxiredoxin
MTKKAFASWQGTAAEGTGRISTESPAVLKAAYAVGSRFASKKGTSPEELIAAAHAACFNMALAEELERQGLPSQALLTSASVVLDRVDGAWCVTRIDLEVKGMAAGVSEDDFAAAAERAKADCPMSRALNAEIYLTAKLEREWQFFSAVATEAS